MVPVDLLCDLVQDELVLRYASGVASGASGSGSGVGSGSDAFVEAAFFFVCVGAGVSTLGKSNCPALARPRRDCGKQDMQ
jgi:hypothetical protein